MVSVAQAELFDRGAFIYDDVLDITWTQDANINGQVIWGDQVAWAAGLSIVDTRPGAGGVIYDDWRLPSMDLDDDDTIVDCSSAPELNCRDNEYGYMYHQNDVTAASPGFFSNVEGDTVYWSGTAFAPEGSEAWYTNFGIGSQGHASKNGFIQYGWAVRSGDVAVVPVPAAVWMFGSALGLLGWMRRRKSA
jgi:hypothetical protein